jgi:hypothetical protein
MGIALPASAQRSKEAPAALPPQPMPLEIKARRGVDTDIQLRIYGGRTQTLTFLIRKPPRAGRLSAPRNITQNAAVVRYRPPEDLAITHEEFEYAVKSTEGVSAPVPVRIEILDVPAALVAPAEADFGKVLSGATPMRTIEVQNQGGLIAEGEVAVTPPWRIEGSPQYRLEGGARTAFRVVFAPEKAGEFLGELILSSQRDRVTLLRGSADDPVSMRPSSVRLAPDLDALRRVASLEVTNHTGAPVEPVLELPAELEADAIPPLAPGGSATVLLRTKPGAHGAIQGEVKLRAGPHSASASVEAAALPAVIRPIEPRVDFGLVQSGTKADAVFSVKNLGGMPGTARLSVSEPFSIAQPVLALAPGAAAQVRVVIAAAGLGLAQGRVEIHAGGTVQTVELQARMTPHAREPSAAAQDRPRRPPAPAAIRETQATNPSRETFQAPPLPTLIAPAAFDATSCRLEWTADLSPATDFIAEIRQLSLGNSKLEVSWARHFAWRVERRDGKISGILENLTPGTFYYVRVVGLSKDSRPNETVFETSFRTPGGKKGRLRLGWGHALGTAAIALLILVIRQRLQTK